MTVKAGFKDLVRARMARSGESYQKARDAVEIIRGRMCETDESFDEAEAWYDDPANELLCRKCGWTVGMICPECASGCGCNNFTCTGWRHQEFMDEDELAAFHACPECGGDTRHSPYTCACGE